tara:strand:- start:615 stop:1238 length:624 start_codon:yes stop_codon:yes gene_type:complete
MVSYLIEDKFNKHKERYNKKFKRLITDQDFVSALSKNKKLQNLLDDKNFRTWILDNNLTRDQAKKTIQNIHDILHSDDNLKKFPGPREEYEKYIENYILVFLDLKDTIASSTSGTTHICIYDNNEIKCVHNASNNSDITNILSNNNIPDKEEVFICETGMCENSSKKAKGEICCIHKKSKKQTVGGKTKKRKKQKRKSIKRKSKKYK